jgi:hypothetical protein
LDLTDRTNPMCWRRELVSRRLRDAAIELTHELETYRVRVSMLEGS